MTEDDKKRYRLKWTRPTLKWWTKLGHVHGCVCQSVLTGMDSGGGQRTVDGSIYKSVWGCWNYAVGQLHSHTHGLLTPREVVWATRAMYAFRDRVRRTDPWYP